MKKTLAILLVLAIWLLIRRGRTASDQAADSGPSPDEESRPATFKQ